MSACERCGRGRQYEDDRACPECGQVYGEPVKLDRSKIKRVTADCTGPSYPVWGIDMPCPCESIEDDGTDTETCECGHAYDEHASTGELSNWTCRVGHDA
jgi:hypothetical protein